MLYAIDSAADTISLQTPPNDGTLTNPRRLRLRPAGPVGLRHRRHGQRRLHRHAHEPRLGPLHRRSGHRTQPLRRPHRRRRPARRHRPGGLAGLTADGASVGDPRSPRAAHPPAVLEPLDRTPTVDDEEADLLAARRRRRAARALPALRATSVRLRAAPARQRRAGRGARPGVLRPALAGRPPLRPRPRHGARAAVHDRAAGRRRSPAAALLARVRARGRGRRRGSTRSPTRSCSRSPSGTR